MLTQMTKPPNISLKPRVLIADDSRIVRATLIKHIQGMFEFREAVDGEQAWETLLLDPNIRVLITDLTMPKLDGYGLLARIRTSKIARIRNLPVIVVSGSDEQEERKRAKQAGATDLITKGIGTAQLLSQLDVLTKLSGSQSEFESGLEPMAKSGAAQPALPSSTLNELETKIQAMLASMPNYKRNIVLFNISICAKTSFQEGSPASLLKPDVVNAIFQLLNSTVRQIDLVALTGNTEFTIVTSTINLESARTFAERLCHAIAGANMASADGPVRLSVSCGLVAQANENLQQVNDMPNLALLMDIARRRAALGMSKGLSCVIGADEETQHPVQLANPA